MYSSKNKLASKRGKKKERQKIYKVPLYLQYLRMQLLVSLVNFGLANSKTVSWDFPGGLVANSPPANAADTGLMVWKIPHAAGQLSLCAPTTEARAPWSLCSTTERSHRNEKPERCNTDQPPLPQLEKARTQQPRPRAAKNGNRGRKS